MNEEFKRPTIKSWAEEDRPREKLLEKGAPELTNAELIAILIGSGTKELTAVDLAKIVLDNAGNDLNRLGKLSINDLCKIKGIGEARAVTIAAALELGRRRKDSEKPKIETIRCAGDVYEIFASRLAEAEHEEFWMLYLAPSKVVIAKDRISKGGSDKTAIDVKIIVKNAINHLANTAIAIHNHPSGALNPSSQDLNLTKKIKTALEYFDIKLLDHVIVSYTGYYSFADNGVI